MSKKIGRDFRKGGRNARFFDQFSPLAKVIDEKFRPTGAGLTKTRTQEESKAAYAAAEEKRRLKQAKRAKAPQ